MWCPQYVFTLFFVQQVCETYPRDLYVPVTASKPIIVGSSKFRSKGRFPVLTYFYQEKKVYWWPPHCTILVQSNTSTYTKIYIISWSKFSNRLEMPVFCNRSLMCPRAFHSSKTDTFCLFLQQAAVCRCSQPLSGFSARCLEDESMLQAISKANHNSRFVYVMDTRPKVASWN